MNHSMFEAHVEAAKRYLQRAYKAGNHSPAEQSMMDCLEEIIAAIEAANE